MTERIGRYEIVKPLAEGDRGKLYLARSTGYGGFARHVVIKTFEELPGAAEGPFIEETLDLGRLHHQHITPVLDVGREGARFYVALDFVHGRSAREVWQQAFTLGAHLPLDFSISVVAAIASGLHYVHTRRRGLLHGHVSLSNVLIGFDGAIQLIGFAGASARGLRASETQLGFSKDQLAYLAPEQARRAGSLDARTDVFALGVILYELTTMRRAFRDDSDRLTIERVKIGSYVKPRSIVSDFPPELERIIARALHIDRDARYPNAEMMRRELVAVGHHMDLVLGDAAVVEVMTQLFEDSAIDPWASAYHADNAPDALAPAPDPNARRRSLRAATETVDALAIELEIPVEARGATTDSDAAPGAPPASTADVDDTRATNPTGESKPPLVSNDTDGVPVLVPLPLPLPVPAPAAPTPASTADVDDTRATNPIGESTPSVISNDTDGVPVLVPVRAPAPAAPPVEVRRPSARKPLDYRLVAAIAAISTIGVTTAVALALRGTSSSSSKPIDAAIAIDAAVVPVDAVVPDAAIDAPADASTTVQLQITSTPPNGTVLLDGKKLGKTPLVRVVDRAEGKHVLKVRMSGYVTGKAEVELTGDITQEFTLVRTAVDAGGPEGSVAD